MFSVKKILKRTLGGLKMAAAWAPIILAPAGFLAFLGTGIPWLVTLPDLNNYTSSDIYQQEFVQDLTEYQEAFENGDLTQKEFVEKVNAMDNEEYVNEVLARDIPGNEEWRAYMKSANTPLGIASLSCLGVALTSFVLLLPWYVGDVKENLEWSADDDFDWEPPKKEPKPPKEEKPVNKIKNDISEDEEELGTTDDFISSLQ